MYSRYFCTLENNTWNEFFGGTTILYMYMSMYSFYKNRLCLKFIWPYALIFSYWNDQSQFKTPKLKYSMEKNWNSWIALTEKQGQLAIFWPMQLDASLWPRPVATSSCSKHLGEMFWKFEFSEMNQLKGIPRLTSGTLGCRIFETVEVTILLSAIPLTLLKLPQIIFRIGLGILGFQNRTQTLYSILGIMGKRHSVSYYSIEVIGISQNLYCIS